MANPITAITTRSAPYSRLKTALADVLLVQADASGAHTEVAIERSDRLGGGIVLTGAKALQKAEHLVREKKYERPILIDRARYAGKNRALASHAFDSDWVARQRALGLPALMPDAGYIGERDYPGLRDVLERTADLGSDVVALLPLHVSWLKQENLRQLVDAVTDVGVPIAVALEHKDDPLSAQYAVYGLVALLQTPVPVLLLRCDTSSIGALAYGALAAAVGTHSALRHIYPVVEGGGGGGRNPKPAAVVQRLLSYVHLDKIDLTAAMDPDHPDWHCSCDVCNGQSLMELNSAPNPEQIAFLHSIEILFRIRTGILLAGGLAQRRAAWTAQCSSAQFNHMDIDNTVSAWEIPDYLNNWVKRGNDTGGLSAPAIPQGARP
ncbi:hypothetical protein [Amycolatopsis sp. cg9]|uniref:hypothetical protein n=1 Tax=Amycolatopsis sp. cg9 TaxID=3238801 RepID=UPI0035235D7D